MKETYTDIRQLVAADKLENAMDIMAAAARQHGQEVHNELIIHQCALQRSRHDLRRGLISREQNEQTRQKTGYAVLELLELMGVGSVFRQLPARLPKAAQQVHPCLYGSYQYHPCFGPFAILLRQNSRLFP